MRLRGRNRRWIFNRTKARWSRASTVRLALARSAWRSFGPAQLRTGARVAKFGFEGVKILQVFEEPSRHFRGGLAGVVKFAPHMGQAAGEHDRLAAAPGEAVVGFVAIALQDAAEVHRDDLLQARRGTTGLPMKEDIAARDPTGPEVTELGFPVAAREIAD